MLLAPHRTLPRGARPARSTPPRWKGRSGAFISGRKKVVGYSVDDISGYDLYRPANKLWTAKLDLGGGTVCFVSEPDRAVKTFTVAYGEGSYCPKLATIPGSPTARS